MKRFLRVMLMIGVVTGAALVLTPSASALPDYAAKTGQTCGACHVNPSGGGALTSQGAAFAAIATHAANPAAAWQQVTAPAPAPTPAPAAPPAAAPAAAAPAPATLPTTGEPALAGTMGFMVLGGVLLLGLGLGIRKRARKSGQ